LENAAATAAALTAIILAVGPVSGAHLNPAVTLADWRLGGISGPDGLMYAAAQIVGGTAGAIARQRDVRAAGGRDLVHGALGRPPLVQ
jgi:glycerol uptake facilitator-like aquaporin